MRIYSAALAGCVFVALVLAGGVFAAGRPGGSGGGDNAAARQAAGAACKTKGLQADTVAFRQCVRGKLGGKKGGGQAGGQGGNGFGASTGGNPQQRAAGEACKATGLQPDTDGFRQCVKGSLGGKKGGGEVGGQGDSGPGSQGGGQGDNGPGGQSGGQGGNGPGASGGANPQPRAAGEACKATGLQPDTVAFRQCVKGKLGGGKDGNGPGAQSGGQGSGDGLGASGGSKEGAGA